jgi:hypothetical protein
MGQESYLDLPEEFEEDGIVWILPRAEQRRKAKTSRHLKPGGGRLGGRHSAFKQERQACRAGHLYAEAVPAGEKRPRCKVCRNIRAAGYRAQQRTESATTSLRKLKLTPPKQDFWTELSRG